VDISFRRLLEPDLPVLAWWLGRAHVRRWWQEDPEVDAVRERYRPAVQGTDPTDLYVVVLDGRDIGMIQSYRLAAHPEWASILERTGHSFPTGASIDYLIGDQSLTGRGVGSAMVEAFSTQVFDTYGDVTCIVVSPQAANRASCRILEKAGYQLVWTGQLDSPDPADFGVTALYVRERA
jgi:aminoglycoside 6'-N-acetyltransferase